MAICHNRPGLFHRFMRIDIVDYCGGATLDDLVRDLNAHGLAATRLDERTVHVETSFGVGSVFRFSVEAPDGVCDEPHRKSEHAEGEQGDYQSE
jgi:hypothetical protein